MARKSSEAPYVVVTPVKANKQRFGRGEAFPAKDLGLSPEQIDALLKSGAIKILSTQEEPEATSGGPPAS